MSSGASFLQDVLKHFEEFARAAGINPEDVYVRLTPKARQPIGLHTEGANG